ncbi:MAG: hypothetical protein LBH44_11855 [Treponema sp.]|jgi:hypothetical protein|nr:hypothetical protein [Treponema sp.]
MFGNASKSQNRIEGIKLRAEQLGVLDMSFAGNVAKKELKSMEELLDIIEEDKKKDSLVPAIP